MKKGKDILSIGQAAKLLGVSMQTLRRWDESGKLRAFRSTEGGYRYYRESDIMLSASNLVELARAWAEANAEIPREFYCSDTLVFQSRLLKMEQLLQESEKTKENFSLLVAMAGEIGNNSYDHNLGNWPDAPGTFFGYDVAKGIVVLADRGVGVLATLRRVKPTLQGHQDALRTAFTERISGREPERRGNGLKFVQSVIAENDFNLMFQSGDAEVELHAHDPSLHLHHARTFLRGCLVVLRF